MSDTSRSLQKMVELNWVGSNSSQGAQNDAPPSLVFSYMIRSARIISMEAAAAERERSEKIGRKNGWLIVSCTPIQSFAGTEKIPSVAAFFASISILAFRP
jgi:hypothetical protein